tara:strand:+ start:114 stop:548 length:435 start_codon:yes stop_codon:yes gene_type:complete
MQYWSTYNFIGYGLMKTKLVPICSPLKTSIIITSLLGGYMTYIYPRRFVLKYNDVKYELEHKYIMLFDFFIHQLPLIDIIQSSNEITLCGGNIFYPMILWKFMNEIYNENTNKIYGIPLRKIMYGSFGIFSLIGFNHHYLQQII